MRGDRCNQPAIAGLAEVTLEPARYGFHATLKAPFTMNSGMKRVELGDAVALIAAQMETVTIQSLALREIDGFLALGPMSSAGQRVSFLVNFACVRLDTFRAQAFR